MDKEPETWDPRKDPPAYAPILAPVDDDTARTMGSLTRKFAVELVALMVLVMLLA